MADSLPPLGTREGLRIEFKRADKLREKRGRLDLVRGVVAMRNASGGDIYVGALEQGDELTGFDPLTDSEREHVSTMRDLLVDRIEPRPTIGRDVTLDQVPLAGGWVLRISVRARPKNEVYASFVDGNAREFLERTGSRLAVISHSKLFSTPAHSTPQEPSFADRARKSHEEWIARWKTKTDGLLAISVVPSEDFGSGDLESWKRVLEAPPPELAGVSGATWHVERFGAISARSDRLIQAPKSSSVYCRLEVDRSSALRFCTDRDWIAWRGGSAGNQKFIDEPTDWATPAAGRLDARALVGIVASTLRLAARLGSDVIRDANGEDARVCAIVTLTGMQGWIWPLGHPAAFHTFLHHHWLQMARDDLTSIVERNAREFVSTPDASAFDLLTKIYEESAHDDLERVMPQHIVWFNERKEFAPPQ